MSKKLRGVIDIAEKMCYDIFEICIVDFLLQRYVLQAYRLFYCRKYNFWCFLNRFIYCYNAVTYSSRRYTVKYRKYCIQYYFVNVFIARTLPQYFSESPQRNRTCPQLKRSLHLLGFCSYSTVFLSRTQRCPGLNGYI